MPSRPTPAASLALLCLVALGLTACGRRGSLEAPSTAARATTAPSASPTTLATRPGAVVTTSPDDESEAVSSSFVSPQPTPVRPARGYTVLNEPFVLDPLL